MTIRSRLIFTIAGISLLLAVPAIYGASKLTELRALASEQRLRHGAAFLALGRLQAALAELDRYARSYIAVGGADQRAGMERSLAESGRQLAVLRERGYSSETRSAATRIEAIDISVRHVIDLISLGRMAEATVYFQRVKILLQETNTALDGIASAVDARSGADLAAGSHISRAAILTTMFGMLAALAAVLGLGYWTTHAVTTPMHQLRESMARVAGGNYIVPRDLPYLRQDEIGDLSRSFSWMTQQLAGLDRMKAEFISIVTHELKMPINVISGYSQLVDEGLYGDLTTEQKRALHAIHDQAHVLTRLVNQLLDVSRLEAGGLILEMHEVVLEDLIDGLDRSFSMLARRKNIDLAFVVDPGLPRTMQGDADRLRDQVLGNLLSNALKFTPEGGSVTVRTWGDDCWRHIEVADTGIGIAAEQLPFVFEKFYQAGRKSRSKGAGLGLAIAREVVETHSGRISVKSTEDVGTTFLITLPVHQHERAVSAAPPVPAGHATS